MLHFGMNNKYNSERGSKFLRFFDRYLGIPIVYGWGKMRKRVSEHFIPPQEIGILQIAGIGDALLLDGVIKDIKKKWPKAKLVFFAARNNYEIVNMFIGLDELYILPIKKPWLAAKKIQDVGKFDLWLDFGPWPRLNALLSLMSNSSFKVGFKSLKQYRHYGYDILAEHCHDVHELDNYRNLVRAVGVDSKSEPAITPDLNLLKTFPDLRSDQPYVVLHMFPGGYRSYMREWPEEFWVAVGRTFLEMGWQVVFTGAQSDECRASIVAMKLSNPERVVSLAGRANLRELSALLKQAKLVISVNTGTMHMAAAVGSSLIAIHGPTSPLRWGPISHQAVVISPENMSCAPCLHFGFEYKCAENLCLRSITPQVVLNAALNMLSGK